MASHVLENISKLPELRKKIIVTFVLIFVYRIGVHIPTPGIDTAALSAFFKAQSGTLFAMFDMFSGGALERLSVFALGIMPYITASIIFQLLTVAIPHLEQLSKEGERGRKKITQYTRYATVLLSLLQGFGISVGLESMVAPGGAHIVLNPGIGFKLMAALTLASGTAFIMWLGEQITERGIGNGISLIIFAGIVARLPSAISNTFKMVSAGEIGVFSLIIIVVIMVAAIACIIFMEQAQRRIPVQYAKRVVGRKVYGGVNTHLPLKINTSGVIPAIFASSLLMFPATLANFAPGLNEYMHFLQPGAFLYNAIYVAFICFFCFFYTAVIFNPNDIAENMKRNGGFIPGIRPGTKTAEYIDRVLTRITVGGAAYISVVCVLPTMLAAQFNVPFHFGGTALLIVVGVSIDTMAQLESHMISRNYEGFLKKGGARVKGRY